jgi:AraC family transcriptional regulator of adaptative response/methylated-DNA-[protein]-cysteine methyltransferase
MIATKSKLYTRCIETPIGAMLAAASHDGLCLLEFADRVGVEEKLVVLQKRMKCTIQSGENPHLALAECELKSYFADARLSFTVPLVMSGTAFEKAVWQQLCEIPVGETRTYAQIAAAIS